MRKGCKVAFVFLFTIFLALTFVSADNETSESDQISKAYSCLKEKVDEKKCDNLELSENIFTTLATGKCKKELLEKSDAEKCWPNKRCSIEKTAQSILALDRVGKDTEKAEQWLLDHRMVPTDLVWYLEIEEIDSDEGMNCEISYRGRTYPFEILKDKRILNSAGSCLTLKDGEYWFTVSPDCYKEEFEITCDKTFLTTFLFRQKNSQTIHVIDKVNSAPENSKTVEKINSFCFGERNECNYEGSLWATEVLQKLNYDVSAYVPYLLTSAQYQKSVFPEPLLYMITADDVVQAEIMNRQINGQYWKEAKDRFYDTALALLPFSNQDFSEKDSAIEWLLDVQQSDGCWDGGNIRNNAFLLYSVWPRYISDNGDDTEEKPDNDCILSNYECTSTCEPQNVMENYECAGIATCCSVDTESKTCSDVGGEICGYDEYCELGSKRTVSDTSFGEVCCVSPCQEKSDEPISSGGDKIEDEYDCESNGGICQYSCDEGYTETTMYSCSGGEICCKVDTTTIDEVKKSMWWIWVLFALIILVVVAIIYREKIKEYIEKMKGEDDEDDKPGFGNGPSLPRRPPIRPQKTIMPSKTFPSYSRATNINKYPQRKIIPKSMPQRPPQRPVPKKSPRELDDVLKKLKEMSD